MSLVAVTHAPSQVIDFTATWCPPCQMIKPIFEKLSTEHTDVNFIKVDVDEAQDIAQQYSIKAMSVFFLVKGSLSSYFTGQPSYSSRAVKKYTGSKALTQRLFMILICVNHYNIHSTVPLNRPSLSSANPHHLVHSQVKAAPFQTRVRR
jgi:thiol-disulfide isomerase/thioredoxin